MEHESLTLEQDKNLIEKILDDVNMRYIILFLYIIRNDLFKDLSDDGLIESYERVLNLDEIYKDNIEKFWDDEFISVAVDLGLFKNIRTMREFKQKEGDFIIKLGDETITIEEDTISVPDDVLFLMINKKFKKINRRDFNQALIRLKSVMCETSNVIHSFIHEIGEHDYTLANDLYYILDQFGNIYLAIKMELTIEGLHDRLKEIRSKVEECIKIFDPVLLTKPSQKKIKKAFNENKDVIKFLKDEGIQLSDKFDSEKIDKSNETYIKWRESLLTLLKAYHKLDELEDKIIKDIKSYYSGKKRKYSYLKFIEKISFNEDGIIDKIQQDLIKIREELIQINEEISKFSKKDIQLLNLDYERLRILSSDN